MECAHYTAIDNFEKILRGDGLHFHMSHYNDMDEPHEISWANSELEKLGLLEPEDENDKSYPYVLSMSGKIDDMTMWRLFGNDGKGLCLVLDPQKITVTDVKPRCNDDDTPKCFYSDVVYGVDNEAGRNDIATMKKCLFRDGLFSNELLCSFLKPRDFEVEDEHRFCHINYVITDFDKNKMISMDEKEDCSQILIKTTSRGPVRYVEKIFSSEALIKIIVGWRNNDNTTEILESYLRTLGTLYDHVSVKKSQYPLTKTIIKK